MILTPEQIEKATTLRLLTDGKGAAARELTRDLQDTLIAYAEIVERVAEMDPTDQENLCPYCNHYIDQVPHAPDCTYLAARKLRGKE